MNEYDEVLNEIDIFCSPDTINKVKELVERATPMKVIKKVYDLLCPNCNEVVGYFDDVNKANYIDNYCWNCGQKLGNK